LASRQKTSAIRRRVRWKDVTGRPYGLSAFSARDGPSAPRG
jgi:hypothetical protein